MFGLGFGEITAIVIIAVLIFGPDKLPEVARQAAGFIKTFRKMADDAKAELRKELGDDLGDFHLNDLRELDPRKAVRDSILGDSSPSAPVAPTPAPLNNTFVDNGVPAPFDDEAT